MFKILLSLFIILGFTACLPEPEENEFTKMRRNMERQNEKRFAGSKENLTNRTNVNKRQKVRHLTDVDEELRLQQEAEKRRWLAVNIDAVEAEDWKALHLSPKGAQRWKKTGLSYNTIAVLIKQDVFPSEAIAFMNRKFDKSPKAFAAFAEPLYHFQHSCETVLEAKSVRLSVVSKQCKDYVDKIIFSSISGYMADEYGDNDLALEYISKLRQLDSQKAYIQTLMEKKSRSSMVETHKQDFALLFPIIERSPTEEEMHFVQKYKLALKDTKRYKSYEYYDFWINKEKNEEIARVSALKRQRALKVAKQKRLQQEAYRMQALAYNKMVASECGDVVSADPSTGEKVHVEGKIVYTIGKRGSNIYAFVVKNKKDGKNYIIRNLNPDKKINRDKPISWTATTVGRVVSISVDEDDATASYDHYTDTNSKEYYPMLKYSSDCAYKTKDLRK